MRGTACLVMKLCLGECITLGLHHTRLTSFLLQCMSLAGTSRHGARVRLRSISNPLGLTCVFAQRRALHAPNANLMALPPSGVRLHIVATTAHTLLGAATLSGKTSCRRRNSILQTFCQVYSTDN